jgi:hypothetical protein
VNEPVGEFVGAAATSAIGRNLDVNREMHADLIKTGATSHKKALVEDFNLAIITARLMSLYNIAFGQTRAET